MNKVLYKIPHSHILDIDKIGKTIDKVRLKNGILDISERMRHYLKTGIDSINSGCAVLLPSNMNSEEVHSLEAKIVSNYKKSGFDVKLPGKNEFFRGDKTELHQIWLETINSESTANGYIFFDSSRIQFNRSFQPNKNLKTKVTFKDQNELLLYFISPFFPEHYNPVNYDWRYKVGLTTISGYHERMIRYGEMGAYLDVLGVYKGPKDLLISLEKEWIKSTKNRRLSNLSGQSEWSQYTNKNEFEFEFNKFLVKKLKRKEIVSMDNLKILRSTINSSIDFFQFN